MAKIRINRRKEYREALRTYIRMARSLITKLDKEFKKLVFKIIIVHFICFFKNLHQ